MKKTICFLSFTAMVFIVIILFRGNMVGTALGATYYTRAVNNTSYTVSRSNYNSYESTHFQFLWGNSGDSNKVTRTFLQKNAEILEDCWSIYMDKEGMTPPTHSVNPSSDRREYKVNVVIFGTGVRGYESGWACAGLDNSGFPYLMCAVGAMSYSPQTWVTPHEFGHVVHFGQGNNSWGNNGYLGPWYEPVANWFREQYLADDKYTGNEGYRTDFSALYLRQTNLMACNGRAYYEAWPILEYLENNPDHLAGYGKGFVASLLKNGTRSDTFYSLVEKMNSNVSLADTIGCFASHMATFDLGRKANYRAKYQEMLQKSRLYWQQFYTMPEKTEGTPNTYKVPMERAPQATGYNVIPLEADFSSGDTVDIKVSLNGLTNVAGADWRARIAVEDASKVTRYSKLFCAKETMTMTVKKGESAYVSIAATPTLSTMVNCGIATWEERFSETKIPFSAKTQYPYEITLTNAAPQRRVVDSVGIAGTKHQNGGGFVARTASVASSVYVGLNAKVLGNAVVTGNVRIEDYAVVQGSAKVSGNAVISGYAIVDRYAVVSDYAYIGDNAVISDGASASGHAKILESAFVSGTYKVSQNAIIKGMSLCMGIADKDKSGSAFGQAITYGDFFDDMLYSINGGAFAGYECVHGSTLFSSKYARNNNGIYQRNYTDGLYAGYEFDKDSSMITKDSYEASSAVARNTPAWSGNLDGKSGVLSFNGTNQSLELDNSLAYFDDMQIKFGMRYHGGNNNQKAFYFGNDSSYMYFTPSNDKGYPQFVICGGSKEYAIPAKSKLPIDTWTDVTITFSGNTTLLTIGNVSYGTTKIATDPKDIAASDALANQFNYLARDPRGNYLNGSFDYFRVYHKNANNISINSYTDSCTVAGLRKLRVDTVTGSSITAEPTSEPQETPTAASGLIPTGVPTAAPIMTPEVSSTEAPVMNPIILPTKAPQVTPKVSPTEMPIKMPKTSPAKASSVTPEVSLTKVLSVTPKASPTEMTSIEPKDSPTKKAEVTPTNIFSSKQQNHGSFLQWLKQFFVNLFSWL